MTIDRQRPVVSGVTIPVMGRDSEPDRRSEPPGTMSRGRPAPVAWLLVAWPFLLGLVIGIAVGWWGGGGIRLALSEGGLAGITAMVIGLLLLGLFVVLGILALALLAVVHDSRIGQPFAGAAAGIVVGAALGMTFGPVHEPAIEVEGRLKIVLAEPGVTLSGDARCSTPEDSRTIGSVSASALGEVGGHRVGATLYLDAGPDTVTLEVFQGAEDLPEGMPNPTYSGQLAPIDLVVTEDRTGGSFGFTGLALPSTTSPEPGTDSEGVSGPFVGVDWPAALSGSVEWTCGAIPTGPIASEPAADTPRSAGAATLSGAISGSFMLEGDCPTPEAPDGYMIGNGTADGEPATLDVSFLGGDVAFGMWPPGDKEDRIGGRAPLVFEPRDDGGWEVSVEAEPAGAGAVRLDVRWVCAD